MNYYINYNPTTGQIITLYVTGINDLAIASPPAGTANLTTTQAEFQLTIDVAGYTVNNGILVAPPAPTSAQLLATAQAAQLALLESAWRTATLIPVSYSSVGGVAKTYQTDATSISNLTGANIACAKSGATPAGFFWVAADNTQVPFTYADLQGLAAVIFAQSAADFAHYQTQKVAIRAALTVAAVTVIIY